MHITLCAINSFFSYISIQSFFLCYFVVLRFSIGVLQKTFHAMISNRKKDWCDVIHMLKLLVHFPQNIALFFFKPICVKPIDYVFCVTRHARSDKTDKIATYWVYKRNKKCLSFYVVSLQKKYIYLEDGVISWREFSLSAFWEHFIAMTRWIPQKHGLFSYGTYVRSRT